MPQPIDPSTEIARTVAAERIQQLADRASLAAQQRGAAEADEERLEAESQVRESQQKSEEVNRELRRRNPYMGKKRRRKKGQTGQGPDAPHTFYNAAEREEVVEIPAATTST